ncbi:uncharacterized protein MYCFIDRAFT_64015 [Pseudocercospora fijiensis CIRAD86]|uniref:Uncharacterized protein n=1 Tax=Pseudocercospora fijiensis (strain CIRAD86) TaxID=383855 RepID=M3A395_PSEFD|nr:uncharacterized protein MYCFIDRAFT_64015 [Pseudocercospora fijiensis CIRAD86]EME79116.1 hypothetical protein MYCFIDRAFT_64015 [Pseudocercospora fijiensis CIRAD86]
MRAALRLLASVQRSTQFLETGAPTGLTGLLTHSSPRTTLLFLYHDTLDRLKALPEHSLYRQSTEALTKHRLKILEETKPQGLEEWQKRVASVAEGNTDAFKKFPTLSGDGYNIGPAQPEGLRSAEERANQHIALSADPITDRANVPRIEGEPSLTAAQINEIEAKIGAGLIEEVIQVAEGEHELVRTLAEAQVWEDLEEKPQPGQWKYHERDTHTGKTQAP